MSDDPGHVEMAGETQLERGTPQPRVSGKGPFILAKVIVSYLQKKKEGCCTDYDELVSQLSTPSMTARDMGKWLQALKLCVSHLREDCTLLVMATLRLPWYRHSQSLVELYIDYLANLLSAQVCHIEMALSTLTSALLGPDTLTLATKSCVDETYCNIHRALKTLLTTVPRAVPLLVPALNKQYPFRTRGADIQEVAVRNCLHVTTYCPTITEDILYLLINKMITIDAEIRTDDDEMMEIVSDEDEFDESETQFHVDMEQGPLTSQVGGAPLTVGESSASDGCHGSETTPTDNGCRGEEAPPPSLGPSYSAHRVMRNGMSESLDIQMRALQRYAETTCFQCGKLVIEEAVTLLQTLLKIFSDVILPTHAISHVQFLLFYVTSFHKEFPGFFLDFLWKKVEDVNVSAVHRQTAAAYMASYIARSKFVSVETAKLCLLHMMQWLHQYLDVCDPTNLGPFVDRHGAFFSVSQAAFYIFVFRHQSLVDMEDGLSFLRNLNFERIISSKLNPLRVCLPSVVEKFSKLASQHEVAFCYTILEANKRMMLVLEASLCAKSATHTTNYLDCFFPFDPYCLQRSGEVIRPLYQEWDGDENEVEEEEEANSGDGHHEDVGSLPSSCLSVSQDVSYGTSTPTRSV